MSSELVEKMRAAATEAIIAATPPAEEPSESDEGEVVEASGEEGSEEGSEEPGEELAEPANAEAPEDEDVQEVADEMVAVRRSADRRVRKAQAQVEELTQQLHQAARIVESAKKQVAEEIFRKLRRAPARTFTEYGLNFQDLIDAGMREGGSNETSPDIEELRSELRSMKAEQAQNAETNKREAYTQGMAKARHAFLGQVSETDAPTLYTVFREDTESLWQEALQVAERYYRQHGKPPQDIDVVKHLEKRYKTNFGKLGGAKPEPPQAKRPGAKTISTKAASETRSAGKPFGLLSAEERKAALRAAVTKATQHQN